MKAVMFSTTRLPRVFLAAFLLLTCVSLFLCSAEAHHVLAVDLGVEWAKAATLGGGSGTSVNPVVVLNDQANRKTPQCIAFRFLPYDTDDVMQKVERIFSEQALSLEPRFPEQVVCGASMLAGRGASLSTSAGISAGNNTGAAAKETLKDTLPLEEMTLLTYSVVSHPSRDKYAVRIVNARDKKKSELEFSPEELIGMFLAHLKRIAERGLDGEPLRHVVLTVPTHASTALRQTFVDAAAVAGLRTVRLMHGITAAAVQLSYLNAEQFFTQSREKGSKYVMLYDMGSRSTEAAVYELTPSGQQMGTITLLSAVSHETLGGRAFDHCIARYVERELFPKAKPKPIASVLSVSTPAARKAAASLMRAVKSARERLSVNQEAPVIVQGIQENDGGDFTITISRAVFASECSHLFDEAVRLRDAAIAQTNGVVASLRDLTRFEVIGGATRMPKLLERLSDGYGKAVDRTLNSDETIVVGAAYVGATRANIPIRGFRVIEPLMNNVYFSLTPALNESAVVGDKLPQSGKQRHLLFAKDRTILPAVQSMRFKNRTADFTLTLEDETARFARATFIHGVNDSMKAAELLPQRLRGGSKGKGGKERMSLEHTEIVVEATVAESGIPFVSNAYLRATYLKWTATDTQSEEEGNVNTTQNEESVAAEENATNGEGKKDQSSQQTEESSENGAEVSPEEEAADEEEKEKEDATAKTNPEEEQSQTNGNQSAEKKAESRVVRSFPLRFDSAPITIGVNLNKAEAIAARDRLYAFQRSDDERLMRSALRNDLEALILHYKSLDEWEKAEGNTNETNWRETVKDVAQWLDDASDNVEISELQRQHKRMEELKVKSAVTE